MEVFHANIARNVDDGLFICIDYMNQVLDRHDNLANQNLVVT